METKLTSLNAFRKMLASLTPHAFIVAHCLAILVVLSIVHSSPLALDCAFDFAILHLALAQSEEAPHHQIRPLSVWEAAKGHSGRNDPTG
jgi:hypothetical protein